MRSTMPWRSASLASSRGVQASMGRPRLRGAVQAKLMICTTCSALKVVGAPERGASARTETTIWRSAAGSASATANSRSAAAQRARHFQTVFGVQPSRAASSSFCWSAAAPRIMRRRRARVWGQECWRTKPSRTACWAADSVTACGCRPAIEPPVSSRRSASTLRPVLPRPYHIPVRTSRMLY